LGGFGCRPPPFFLIPKGQTLFSQYSLYRWPENDLPVFAFSQHNASTSPGLPPALICFPPSFSQGGEEINPLDALHCPPHRRRTPPISRSHGSERRFLPLSGLDLLRPHYLLFTDNLSFLPFVPFLPRYSSLCPDTTIDHFSLVPLQTSPPFPCAPVQAPETANFSGPRMIHLHLGHGSSLPPFFARNLISFFFRVCFPFFAFSRGQLVLPHSFSHFTHFVFSHTNLWQRLTRTLLLFPLSWVVCYSSAVCLFFSISPKLFFLACLVREFFCTPFPSSVFLLLCVALIPLAIPWVFIMIFCLSWLNEKLFMTLVFYLVPIPFRLADCCLFLFFSPVQLVFSR